MATLYELTADIQELERRLELAETEENAGGVTEYLASELLDTSEALAAKVDAYCVVYRDYQARAQAQRAEGKHLTDMAKANENTMERLKEAVKYASAQLGRSKLQGNSRSITVSTLDRPAIEIVDIDAIPQEFLEVVTEVKVDKKAIADLLMATGEIVEGVEARKVTQVRFN